MSITTRGEKPAYADAPLYANSSSNIAKPITTLLDEGYALQAEPGSAEWNWLMNYVSAGILHCMIYGIALWDTNEVYVVNSFINRNGLIYKSLAGGNSGHVPESSPTFWHDIRRPLPVAVAASGTRTPQNQFNEAISVNTSSATVNLNIGVGQFPGQIIYIEVSGGNTCNVTAGGTNPQPVTNGQRYTLIWNGSSYMQSSVQGKFYGPLVGDVTGNVNGNVTGTASNADKLDNIDSTQFARTDVVETFDQAVSFLAGLSGNLTGNVTGTASNADKLDNIDSTQFARTDVVETFDQAVSFNGAIDARSGLSNSLGNLALNDNVDISGILTTLLAINSGGNLNFANATSFAINQNSSNGGGLKTLDFEFPSITTDIGRVRFFRNTNSTSFADFIIYRGNGSSANVFSASGETNTVTISNLINNGLSTLVGAIDARGGISNSLGDLLLNNNVDISGDLKLSVAGKKLYNSDDGFTGFIGKTINLIGTESVIFAAISPYLPNIGDKIRISGGMASPTDARAYIVSYMERTSSTQITTSGVIFSLDIAGVSTGLYIIDSTDTTTNLRVNIGL